MIKRIKMIMGIAMIIVFLAIAVRMYTSGQYTKYIPSKHTTFRAEVYRSYDDAGYIGSMDD